MKIASESVLMRYSKNDLTIVELLRRTLEEETIADLELNRIVEFYDSDIKWDYLIFEKAKLVFSMQRNGSSVYDRDFEKSSCRRSCAQVDDN